MSLNILQSAIDVTKNIASGGTNNSEKRVAPPFGSENGAAAGVLTTAERIHEQPTIGQTLVDQRDSLAPESPLSNESATTDVPLISDGSPNPLVTFQGDPSLSSDAERIEARAIEDVENLLLTNPQDFAVTPPRIGYPHGQLTTHQLENYLDARQPPLLISLPSNESLSSVRYLLDNPEALNKLNGRLAYEKAASHPPETSVVNDTSWIRDSIQEGDASQGEIHGTITVDGYGELPIAVPGYETYSGYQNGQAIQVDTNANIEDDGFRTVEIVRANSQFQELSFFDRLAAGSAGSAGFDPFTAIDASSYDGAFFSEDGQFFIESDSIPQSPGGSTIPSDFTPPDAPGTTPKGRAVGSAAELLQIGTQSLATINGQTNASHALGQVHIQVNAQGEYRAVVQMVQVSESSTGEGLTSKPVYVTHNAEEGGLESHKVFYPDPRITAHNGPVITAAPGGDSPVVIDPNNYGTIQAVENSSFPPISEF